jgi:hypothetical protein
VCPDNGTSCYFSKATSSSYAMARAACSALNGSVVSYDDAEEQLAVEQYFSVSGACCCARTLYVGRGMPSKCCVTQVRAVLQHLDHVCTTAQGTSALQASYWIGVTYDATEELWLTEDGGEPA